MEVAAPAPLVSWPPHSAQRSQGCCGRSNDLQGSCEARVSQRP